MSSFRRRLLALTLVPALLAPLAGCGFEPLYGKHAEAEYDPMLAAIKIDRIPDPIGQRLQHDLRERLNPHDEHIEERYTLHVVLHVTRHDLGISRSATASRSEVQVTASYFLTTIRGEERIFSNVSHSSSLFNILDDGYATQVALDNATQLAVDDLSRDIELHLAFFARQQRDKG